MSRQHLSIVFALIGVVMLATSVVLPLVDDGRSAWSEQQAQEFGAAATRLKQLSFSPASPQRDAELEQVEAEYQSLRQQLDSAQGRSNRIAWTLRIVGVALLLPAVFWKRNFSSSS